MSDKTFGKWWADDGRMYDPDTEEVPWFDKRKEALDEWARIQEEFEEMEGDE